MTQERHLFNYAVIRVVPRVEREEFINVGVIVYCAARKYVAVAIAMDEGKLKALAPDIDMEEVRQHLQAYEKIARGGTGAGPIGLLDASSRFRWLTAKRSTVIQSSSVHPAFAAHLESKINELLAEQVR